MSELAERGVIGGAMLDKECARKAADALSSEMFTDLDCRKIFDVITDLYWSTNDEPIDIITVTARLPDYKQILIEMADGLPSLSSYDTYVNIVRNDWQLRIVQRKLSTLALDSTDIKSLLGDLADVLDEAQLSLPSLQNGDVATFSQEADAFVEWVEAGNKEGDFFSTGFSHLDAVCGGIQAGSVFILAARPGQGKTDFALNMVMRIAKKGTKILYFSIEMTGTQMMIRVAANLLKINGTRIRDKNLSEDEIAQMKRLFNDFGRQTSLTFVKDVTVSVQDVRRYVERMQPGVIVIDHVGLLQRPNIKEQYRAFGIVIEELKKIAASKKIALIELVQMNRQIENATREPELSDLRESGNLEQSADYVGFLRTKDFGGKILSGSDYAETTLYLKKNRHGGMGKFQYHWQPQYHRYMEVENRYD